MASSSQNRRSRREQLQAQRFAEAKKERRTRIIFTTVGIVVFAVVIGLAVWGYMGKVTEGGTEVPPNANSARNGIFLAPELTGVPTLDIYTDYNCAYCKSANLTLSAVIDQASTDGKANVVIHSLSASTNSRNADIAASCADTVGKFVDYHNQLFINQSSDGSGFDSTMLRSTIPDAVGLYGDDLATFQTCYDSKATGGFVDDQAAFAAKQKITTTPTFLFDGTKINDKILNTVTNTYDPDLLREQLGMTNNNS